MASYQLSIKNIIRSRDRSIVAASAYCSAQKLLDEVSGIEFDFSHREGMVYSEILAPLDAPAWMKDRSTLWNAVERLEKRNAHLARELTFFMPAELNNTQNIKVLKDFCQSQFVAEGIVADVNLHLDGVYSPFAHILLTTRKIELNGFGVKNLLRNKRALAFEYHKALAQIKNGS
jgi:hypothetical protein